MTALDGGECSASRPGRFTLGKILLVTIGQKAGCILESIWTRWRKEKNPSPWRESNPGRPAYSLVTISTEIGVGLVVGLTSHSVSDAKDSLPTLCRPQSWAWSLASTWRCSLVSASVAGTKYRTSFSTAPARLKAMFE